MASERIKMILSMNAALSGAVTPNMRAAFIRKVGNEVQTRIVFYASPSEDELETASIVGTEVIACFDHNETIQETVEVNGDGRLACRDGEEMVFRRQD